MATASTRQRHKQKKALASPAKRAAVESPVTSEVSEKFWLIASITILAVTAVLRLVVPELKPMHHDEGVNGFFLTGLLKNWQYTYQPDNYHGPTLYYFALPFAWAFGLKTWAVRLVPVVFGLGTVWLALCLRRYVGALGALMAAALLAVSPGAVYYSRYFIHEMMFVFFTAGIVVAILKFYEQRPAEALGGGAGSAGASVAAALLALAVALYPDSFGSARVFAVSVACILFAAAFVLLSKWEGDRAIYALLAAISAALMFATKETAFISAVVLILAALIGRGWAAYVRGAGGEPLVARLGGWGRLLPLLVAAIGVFVFVNVVFYSSFFTNAKGVPDSVRALKFWTETGTGTGTHGPGHEKPWYTYIKWLLQEESPILLLGAAGSALALWVGRNRFAVFAGAWAFGMMAAYSLVAYKTPWLVLSFTVPMSVAAGYTLSVLDTRARQERRTRLPVIIIASAALAVGLYQSIVLNFKEYDNDRYPYVYSHTRRDFNVLVGEIKSIAERAGTSTDTRIAVTSPGPGTDSYWPLPWYLNGYKSVGYYGQFPSEMQQMPIVVGNIKQDAELRERLAATHRKVGGTYQLRPGVDLVLYARRDYVVR